MEQSCFVVVRAGSEHAQHGALFQSDESGTNFAFSLPDIHYAPGRSADIVKVQSVEGVYLVNVVHRGGDAAFGAAIEDPDMDEDDAIGDLEDEEVDRHYTLLRTKVTFNRGGTWQYLTAPKVDSRGSSYEQCEAPNECYLHLFFRGNTKGYAPVYSTGTGTGLLMGVGIVADSFTDDVEPDEVSMFFSRDSGASWTEVHKGASIYEFSNYGALMVVAKHQQRTREVLYTWDEGLTWKTVDLPEELEVTNIRTDPQSTGLRFFVLGRTDRGEGTIITIDFTSLHQRACQGEAAAGEGSSDFELWSPRGHPATKSADVRPACVLGRVVSYARRKQGSACHHGSTRDQLTKHDNCPCTKDDYECALGFERSPAGSQICVVVSSAGGSDDEDKEKVDFETDMLALYRNPELLQTMCQRYPKLGEFYAPSGYRRVPGDTCLGGVDLNEMQMNCDEQELYGGVSAGRQAVSGTAIVIMIVAVAGLCVWKYSSLQSMLGNEVHTAPDIKYAALHADNSMEEVATAECLFDDDFELQQDQ